MSERDIIRCDGCGGAAKLAKDALEDVLQAVKDEAERLEGHYGKSSDIVVRLYSLHARLEDLPKVWRARA